ncbi:site-specific integrase [Sphingosinicellaceae bacterium]|nr:site-specific integrase [Sphingosinicellaceae bacterium]
MRIFVPLAKAGSREPPIPAELAETLQAERKQRNDQEGWDFPAQSKSSKSGHRRHLDQSFKRAVLAAGLDPKVVTPHVMRHTAVTRLVKSGADIPTIMKISGLKTVTIGAALHPRRLCPY